jgi:hypothetical protein
MDLAANCCCWQNIYKKIWIVIGNIWNGKHINALNLFNYMNFFPVQVCDIWIMENIKNIENTILTYTSAWNETERDAIAEKISQCWARDATYTDPLTDTITGPDAIADLILSSYGQMGPRTFKVVAEPQVHHQSGRFRWLAIRPEGYPVEGMDYFEYDKENRITRIVGFF